MTPQVWVAIVIGLAAAIEDIAHRQISNWICGAALAAGLTLHLFSEGWQGGVTALLGAAAGFGVFLIFYLLGGMGGGDVKLMAGFGAVLGPHRLLEAALWTAACGGIFAAGAIVFSFLRGLLSARLRGARRFGKGSSGARLPGETTERESATRTAARRPLQSIPYAPAIAAGVWLSLVPKT